MTEIALPALLERVLNQLDFAVVVASPDLVQRLYSNRAAKEILGEAIPHQIVDAASSFILARRSLRKIPPSMRIEIGERAFYLRVQELLGSPPVELITLREEIMRDVELYRLLNSRYGISRREYQVITGLRLGKTNQQLAAELGLAKGTVARHVHRLLERFNAPNRTRLVNMVEQLIPQRG